MVEPEIRDINLGSEGKVTLSGNALKQLGLTAGASLREVLVGNCVILMPKNQRLDQIRKSAQKELDQAGVTVDELKDEVEKIKQERLAERYPNLANEP